MCSKYHNPSRVQLLIKKMGRPMRLFNRERESSLCSLVHNILDGREGAHLSKLASPPLSPAHHWAKKLLLEFGNMNLN